VLLLLFIYGTFYAFLLNAFHEFCHKSVFKTRVFNTIFLQIVSFLSWNNPVLFWTSHQEHHKYILHPPDDLEVVLPIKLPLSFLYWHMNYHTEHHMYAAVPCYNLGKLHDQIEPDLPLSPVGLCAMWKKMVGILKIQEVDPKYQYVAELPARSNSQ
jgi:fatty acid desaturase